MNLSTYNNLTALNSSVLLNPAMFSLVELDSYYMLAIDLPTIPTLATEIITTKNQMTVEGKSENSEENQTIFRFLPKGKDIKTIYKDGVLWLLLPKFKLESSTSLELATA